MVGSDTADTRPLLSAETLFQRLCWHDNSVVPCRSQTRTMLLNWSTAQVSSSRPMQSERMHAPRTFTAALYHRTQDTRLKTQGCGHLARTETLSCTDTRKRNATRTGIRYLPRRFQNRGKIWSASRYSFSACLKMRSRRAKSAERHFQTKRGGLVKATNSHLMKLLSRVWLE